MCRASKRGVSIATHAGADRSMSCTAPAKDSNVNRTEDDILKS